VPVTWVMRGRRRVGDGIDGANDTMRRVQRGEENMGGRFDVYKGGKFGVIQRIRF